jgi:hypothetical protein
MLHADLRSRMATLHLATTPFGASRAACQTAASARQSAAALGCNLLASPVELQEALETGD